MSDVIICCAQEDEAAARRVEQAVARAGYSVWRDEAPSDDFWHSDTVVDRIRSAKAAILVWSGASAASALLHSEAQAARAQRKLIQVSADGMRAPMPFDTIEAVSIASDSPNWQPLLDRLERLCGPGRMPERARAELALRPSPPRPPQVPAVIPARAVPQPIWMRLVDALVPLSITACVALAAAGWMSGTVTASARDRAAAPPARIVPASAPALAPAPILEVPLPAPEPAPEPSPEPAEPPRLELAAAPELHSEPRLERVRAAAKAKPAAKPRPAPRPRIKYKFSENMRLFCQGAGKATSECRTFRRNVRRLRA
jgi:hypothetical protein